MGKPPALPEVPDFIKMGTEKGDVGSKAFYFRDTR